MLAGSLEWGSLDSMRLAIEIPLLRAGGIDAEGPCLRALSEIRTAISLVRWPSGAEQFTIYPESGKKRGMGSGVRPIRDMFVEELQRLGWQIEAPFPVPTPELRSTFGPMDAAKSFDDDLFMVEWETGNISSSHRSMNKLAIGILKGAISGGVLIVPTWELAQYLTDRIGNVRELEPYLSLWSSVEVERGFLAIFAVEHDATSTDVPRIRKGTDGRSLT